MVSFSWHLKHLSLFYSLQVFVWHSIHTTKPLGADPTCPRCGVMRNRLGADGYSTLICLLNNMQHQRLIPAIGITFSMHADPAVYIKGQCS